MTSEITEFELDVGVLQRLLQALDVTAALAHQLLAGAQQVAHLLGLLVRHEAAADQAVRQKIGQPSGVVHVGLASRHVFDMRRVRQHQGEIAVAQDMPHRLPINAGRLHRDMGAALAGKPVRQGEQLLGRGLEGAHRVRHRTVRPRPTPGQAMCRTQATTVSLCTSRPAQCGYRTSMFPPAAAPSAWNPCQGNLTSVLRGRCRPVATIWGAQGLRVRLKHGLIRTKQKPTSVPTTVRTLTPTRPRFISCGSAPPVGD